MSCFKLPVSLCKRIQSLLTRFWWDANPEKKKMCWVAWRKLSTPKALGGLGFRDIQLFNDALLAKLGWRIIKKPESLFARLVLSKYCHDEDFLNVSPTSSISHGWRSILKGRDLLKDQLVNVIGNGANTEVWNDPWILSTAQRKPIGPILHGLENLLVKDLFIRDTGQWNVQLIEKLFPQLTNDILCIKQSFTGAADQLVWRATKSGLYSTKSGYFSAINLDQSSTTAQGIDWNKWVWDLQCQPKVKLFVWKLLSNALPSGFSLQKRGIQVNSQCCHCGLEETTHHIFFECAFAKKVWSLMQWDDNLFDHHIETEQAYKAALYQTILPPFGIGIKTALPQILWNIWKARNMCVFQNRTFAPHEVISKSFKEGREWLESQQTLTTVNSGPRCLPLAPPSDFRDSVIVCSDAAWHKEKKIAGLGCSFSYPSSNRRICFSEVSEFVASPLVAEALAIQAALRRAKDAEITHLVIRTDSRECIKAINSSNIHKDLHGLVCDIKKSASSFIFIAFEFIPRKENSHADHVAKSVLRSFVLDLSLNSHVG